MSPFTSSTQLPNTDEATTQEGSTFDSTPEPAQEDPPERDRDRSGATGTDVGEGSAAHPATGTGSAPDAVESGAGPDVASTGRPAAAACATAGRDVREEARADEDTAVGRSAGDAAASRSGGAEGDQEGGRAPAAAVSAGWRRHLAGARVVPWVTTGLAAGLVLMALLLPNELIRLTPGAFVRIPGEAIVCAAVLLQLPPRARRITAVLIGAGLGLLTILKFIDMGFYSVLDRPFNLVLDWVLFDDAAEFVRESYGRAGEIAAWIGVALAVLAVPILMTLAVLRLSRLMLRHGAVANRATLILATVWITCAAFGLELTGAPLASKLNAAIVNNRAHQISASLKDKQRFAEQTAVDPFRTTPADRLLTGLRGKDVIFAFVESYGRVAIEDPDMAPRVSEVLAKGTERLREAGFSSRSAFLTSPTTGAGSWLAHSTFMSGLWVANQQRYRTATASDRLTLTGAFQRTGAWRTVGVMPGVRRSWPEGKFYDLDKIYDSRQLGYKGPYFSWTPVPDQYTLSAFERLEHGRPGRDPLMAAIILASSHNPWAPIPTLLDWDEVGDGSVYNAIKKAGKNPKDVWQDPDQVRTEYRRAIEYSVSSLVSYVQEYGDEDTVLVFLGDHQPVPTVVGQHADRDVPISIVAHDPDVLDKISGWGWNDGLKPEAKAPVWRMDTFRDRFLTAYGPQPGSTPSASSGR